MIYRASKLDPRTGQRIYAKQYGKKAFRIVIRKGDKPTDKKNEDDG